MPALFAYLIAVALLLGGGYGALSWLAAPEPVKVVAKATPKPPPAPPHYDEASSVAGSGANSFEAPSANVGTNQAPPASNEQPPPRQPGPGGIAAQEQLAQPHVPEPAKDRYDRSATAEVSSERVKQHAEARVQDIKQDVKQPGAVFAGLPTNGSGQRAGDEGGETAASPASRQPF